MWQKYSGGNWLSISDRNDFSSATKLHHAYAHGRTSTARLRFSTSRNILLTPPKYGSNLNRIPRIFLGGCGKVMPMKTLNSLNSIEAWLWCMARLDAMHAHLVRYGFAYIALLFGYWAFSMKYEMNINVSNSLGGTVYLVEKHTLPSRNDYAAFYYPSDFIYPKNARFLKRVVGVPGDTIESKDHQFFVNGNPVGKALPVTSDGRPIEENDFKGLIPSGHYYVQGDHPKSLDSRYKVVGLVFDQMIIGRGYRLF